MSLCLVITTGCDKDEPNQNWQSSILCQQLINTSWQCYSIVNYWNDGSESRRSDRIRPQIYTFKNESANANYVLCKTPLVLEMYNTDSSETKIGTWFIDNNKRIISNVSPSISGDVVSLTSDCLQLRFDYDDPEGCGCDYSVSYYKNIKTINNPQEDTNPSGTDYNDTLSIQGIWYWDNGPYDNGLFAFGKTNNVKFQQSGYKNWGSYGIPYLHAEGSYDIRGSKLECIYDDIWTEAANQFPDWNIGGSQSVIYTIEKFTNNELILDDGNTKYSLEPMW